MVRIDAGSSCEDEEAVHLIRSLRRELVALPEIERVESATSAPPLGSKSLGIDLQSLLVTLAASGGVLTTFIGAVQAWLTRREKSSVTLEIGGDKLTITGASSESERRLVDSWVRRHES
jgi:hypothetical protein